MVKKCSVVLIGALFFSQISSWGQGNSFFQKVVEHSGISMSDIKKKTPQLSIILSSDNYTTTDIQEWIYAYPSEWNVFATHPDISKWNYSWTSLGLTVPNEVISNQHSFWIWYEASGLSEKETLKRFPHFPLLSEKETLDHYGKSVGMWMRLYPKEYERFVNSPELIAASGQKEQKHRQLLYIPRFIGSEIYAHKPSKPEIDDIESIYEYELAIRNWYFVYEPNTFKKLYGNDYDFPDFFDAETYRTKIIAINEELEKTNATRHDIADK